MSCRKKFPATGLGSELCVALVLLSLQLVVLPLASAQRSKVTSKWQTLSGDAPLVIARGGFSGMFPDSSSAAYNLALLTSVPNVIFWCDVQLTKDAAGICFPDLKLDNSSDIRYNFNDKLKEYVVNGVRMKGRFSVDYTLRDLANVSLNQGIDSRTNKFDGSLFPIQTVVDVFTELKPPATLWLNVQHDAFYKQHSLSMRNFVISVSKRVVINYISSPEVDFLRSIGSRFRSSTTKLVFRFLGENEFEPSTNQTYGSLLTNLTFIKTFASGIIVPKYFIQPVDPSLYLQACTSVVSDAHKEGLEVFASGFVNDYPLSYDYSYDPLSEQLAFIDNGNFSVDGVVTDFPVTASEAIDCFAHLGRKSSKQADLLVISKHGASGDYPACTNLAYEKAIRDGADVIDCLVQMSKDGTPFCLSSINLMESTNVLQTPFSNLTRSIPEIPGSGIFTFDIAWSDITKSLRPAISNPQADYKLFRNPKFKDAGAFVSLAEFLALAKNASSLSGVLIGIEHAAYLAEKEQLGVVDAVLDALSEAGYNKQTQKEVMIQSSDSSVLKIFKDKSNYKLGYKVGEPVRDILNGTVEDIKNFAHFVVVNKEAVFPENSFFVTAYTKVVPKLKSFKLPVYVETLSNEFTSQPWDFFSDPTFQINSFYMGAEIDGVITDFPKTAARYTRNRCLRRGERIPPYMTPVEPGTLIQIITDRYLPPAAAPLPVLREENVTEPPLPDVMKATPTSSPGGLAIAPAPASPRSQQPKIVICTFLSYLAVLFTLFLLVS